MNLLAMSRTLGSPAARRVRHLQRHLSAASVLSFTGPPLKTYSDRHVKIIKAAAERAAQHPQPTLLEEILVAGGCFWGVELAFARVPGGRTCGIRKVTALNLMVQDEPSSSPLVNSS